MKTVKGHVLPEQKEKLKARLFDEGMTEAELIRKWVREYIKGY